MAALNKITWEQALLKGDAAGALSLIGGAPLPQAGAGDGEWAVQQFGNNTIGYLPAGGTWEWHHLHALSVADNTVHGVGGMTHGAINAGGTSITPASSGFTWIAAMYEIQGTLNPDFSQPVYARADGTFVITNNGLPYHVLTHEMAQTGNNDFDALYDQVLAWIAAGGQTQTESPTVLAALSPQSIAMATLQQLALQYVNSVMVGPTAPLTQAAAWLAAWKAAGLS